MDQNVSFENEKSKKELNYQNDVKRISPLGEQINPEILNNEAKAPFDQSQSKEGAQRSKLTHKMS